MSVNAGLFNLAQSMQQGQRSAVSGAQGLFDMMGTAMSPSADIKMSDPASIVAAAEGEARRGNTVESNRLMQQAQQVKQQQEAAQVKNIKRSYAQMKALGREAQFEDAMIQAGRVDEIAALKREDMRNEMLAMEFGDATRARKFREISQGYYQAQTEEGRELALQRLADEGFGAEAADLKNRAAEVKAEEIELRLRKEKADWQRQVQQVSAMGVPEKEEDIAKVRESIDPGLRGIYDQQVVAMQANRETLRKARESAAKDAKLDPEFIKGSGMTEMMYNNLYKVSPGKANEQVIANYIAKTKVEASTLPTGVAAEQLEELYYSVNERFGPNRLFMEERYKPQAIQLAWTKMNKEGLGAQQAMDEAIAELNDETQKELSADEFAAALDNI